MTGEPETMRGEQVYDPRPSLSERTLSSVRSEARPMVEQIDRDAAGNYLESRGERALALRARNVGGKLAEAFAAHRAAERARILAAMRQPDAAMVERVLMAGYILTEEDTRAALSAAADHMEAGQ